MIRPYKGVMPTIPDTCYVDVSAQVIGDVVLGEHASIWMNVVVRGDVHYIHIGRNTNIQDNSVLHGMLGKWPVVLGDDVSVGHTATLHGCVVEDRCLIGMGVDCIERRAHRTRFDHRRRNPDSRGNRGRTRLAMDGSTGKVSPQFE